MIVKQQKLIKKLLRRRGSISAEAKAADGQHSATEVTTDTTSKPADYEALNDSSDSAIAGEVRLIVPTLPASTTTAEAIAAAADAVTPPMTGGHPRSENEAISSDQPQASNNGRKAKDERQRISNRQKLLLLKRHHSGSSLGHIRRWA